MANALQVAGIGTVTLTTDDTGTTAHLPADAVDATGVASAFFPTGWPLAAIANALAFYA